jgi:hypothetical protein
MSTAFHPETDGQTERVNQTSKAFLRVFVNLEISDQVEHMLMAEFAYNNTRTIATAAFSILCELRIPSILYYKSTEDRYTPCFTYSLWALDGRN